MTIAQSQQWMPTEWYSVAQLASLNLPGLPADKRTLNRRIAREGWAQVADRMGIRLARHRAGRGGGLEYHVALLPPEARLELSRRQPRPPWAQHASTNDGTRAAAWCWFDRQPSKVHEVARRRLSIVKEVMLLRQNGMTGTAAVARISRDHSISSSTVWSWLRHVRGCAPADWLPALAPRWKSHASEVRPKVYPNVWSDVLAELAILRESLDRIESALCLKGTEH